MNVLTILATAVFLVDTGAPPALDAARRHRDQKGAEILKEFADLLSIPNVASDHRNIRRNAVHIQTALNRRNVKSRLLEVPDAPPVVFGEITVPGARHTFGIYVHYDGQPVDEAQWTNPPWQPTLYTASLEDGGKPRSFPRPGDRLDPEWRIYARGSGDDRAPIAAILAALDALRENDLACRSNFKFFFEGEEEVGSPHLGEFFRTYREKLDADVWLIFDGPWHQSRRPQLVFGVRGITSLEITTYGATRYLHSGHYGNWSPNPALSLAHLLASMKDREGRVTVDRFYESVVPLSAAERSILDTIPRIDDALRRELGLVATEAHNAPYAERLLLPSLNIRGLVCGAVGSRARNVIPPSATAAIDIRLVKGNVPDQQVDLVEAHIRGQGFHIVRNEPDLSTRLQHAKIAKVLRGKGYPAARTAMDLPLAQHVRRNAETVTGESMIMVPSLGGSLPLYLFETILETPTVIVPIANHDNNQHAPDENIRLANLWYGIDLLAVLLAAADEIRTP